MLALIKGTVFPIVFAGSLLAFDALLSAGIEPSFALLAMTIGNMIVVALLEIVFPLRSEWAWWRDAQSINDLVHGALLSVIGPRLGEITLSTSIATAAAYMATLVDGGIWPTVWPLWAQVLLAIAIADFTDWTKHWAYHHVPFIWPVHALHHSPDKMHVFKAGRLHFLEATIRFAVISAPLIALGAGAEVIIWYAAVLNALGNLNHSNVHMPMPGFVHYFFATPDVHRLHHEIDPDLGRANLSPGTMLPDHLFGTFRHPSRHVLCAVGINPNPITNNLFTQLASPLIWPLLVWRRRLVDKS